MLADYNSSFYSNGFSPCVDNARLALTTSIVVISSPLVWVRYFELAYPCTHPNFIWQNRTVRTHGGEFLLASDMSRHSARISNFLAKVAGRHDFSWTLILIFQQTAASSNYFSRVYKAASFDCGFFFSFSNSTLNSRPTWNLWNQDWVEQTSWSRCTITTFSPHVAVSI